MINENPYCYSFSLNLISNLKYINIIIMDEDFENDIDINRGRIVTDAIGDLDIGQCCVVCRGQVLAVEGPEGTDEMLKRVAHLSTSMRGSVRKREGVLVKLPKPNQDRRIDMPTIGLTTIENASLIKNKIYTMAK